ncbi:MAG: DUF2062 domain-containing protein [Candidatus Competibacteraceae bacterium]|nr:MAG: DUF2062 domain-containing protein [Candidatus Competibacteraceae bacterium]
MPMKQLLKRYLPDPHQLREHKSLRFLGEWLHDPWLWHFNRRSTVRGLAVGAFFAFVPFPWQTLLAAVAAIWLRFNLPVAVAMVWITNPLTLPPIVFVNYQFGAWLLGIPPGQWTFEPSLDWLLQKAGDVGLPLLVGSMATAVVAGVATFVIAHLLWRWRIVSRFRRRRRTLA